MHKAVLSDSLVKLCYGVNKITTGTRNSENIEVTKLVTELSMPFLPQEPVPAIWKFKAMPQTNLNSNTLVRDSSIA